MPDTRTDVENLMNAMIPIAIEKLESDGQFAPFGGAMNPKGEIFTLAEQGEEPPGHPDVMIASLKEHMRGAVREGEYKATAIVFDVEVDPPAEEVALEEDAAVTPEPTDAVAVALDHEGDVSVVVLFPYTLEDHKVTVGEIYSTEGEADIFTD